MCKISITEIQLKLILEDLRVSGEGQWFLNELYLSNYLNLIYLKKIIMMMMMIHFSSS